MSQEHAPNRKTDVTKPVGSAAELLSNTDTVSLSPDIRRTLHLLPQNLKPHQVLALQRTIGNRAVQHLLRREAVPNHEAASHATSNSLNLKVGLQAKRVIQRSKPDIDSSEQEMGDHLVKQMNQKVNSGADHDKGIWYAHNYQAYAKRYKATDISTNGYKPYADFWKEDYWGGYADPNYFEYKGYMDWQLKDGKSAAAAIQAWVNGLTIAECYTAIIAIELDALRAAIGDDNFDYLYGTLPTSKKDKPLRIFQDVNLKDTAVAWKNQGGTMTETKLSKDAETDQTEGAVGKMGKRPVKKGEWYYFYNHPKYLLKHPGGAFQGENALYMGEKVGVQKWEGMGMRDKTEQGIYDDMVGAYDTLRDARDYEILVNDYARDLRSQLLNVGKSDETLYNENLDRFPDEYRHDKGVFEATTSVHKILNDPPHTVGGISRQGGFVLSSGKKQDATTVTQLKFNTTKTRLEAKNYDAMTVPDLFREYESVKTMTAREIRDKDKTSIVTAVKDILTRKRVNAHLRLAQPMPSSVWGHKVYIKVTSASNTTGVMSVAKKMSDTGSYTSLDFNLSDFCSTDFDGTLTVQPLTVRIFEQNTLSADTQLHTVPWNPNNEHGKLDSRSPTYQVNISVL